ncbi:heme ABC transporter ATP-binding protein [soil metagenome]
MTVVIECRDVGVLAGKRWLLRNIDLEIEQGEIIALAGPNGAGKSTLLAVMAGDIPANPGSVKLQGTPIESLRPKDLAIRRAVLPQQSVVQFSFTAREIVEMGRTLRDRHGVDNLAVDQAMQSTDSAHLSPRIYPSLSVGEQARVSLARVLAQETPLLLLDEPTAALDVRHQHLVMEVSRNLASAGATIVVILHDLNLAAAFADRIVLMCDGMIAGSGTPWEILSESLLGSVFECPFKVSQHPMMSCPLVLPVFSSLDRSAHVEDMNNAMAS